jgi:hypothetical protein
MGNSLVVILYQEGRGRGPYMGLDIIKNKELTESGFDFIHKPVRSQDLLRKAREVLDK